MPCKPSGFSLGLDPSQSSLLFSASIYHSEALSHAACQLMQQWAFWNMTLSLTFWIKAILPEKKKNPDINSWCQMHSASYVVCKFGSRCWCDPGITTQGKGISICEESRGPWVVWWHHTQPIPGPAPRRSLLLAEIALGRGRTRDYSLWSLQVGKIAHWN